MSKFRIERTDEIISSNSGIILAGLILNCLEFKNCITLALGYQIKYSVDHFTDYEIIKSYIGLLCVGKPRPESIDIFKSDEVFKHALQLTKLPSKETLRQRLEKLPSNLNIAFQEFTAKFIKKYGELPTIKGTNYIPIDFDVTPFDNSNSFKEGVSYTYKKFNGFAPMITYIGATGYMLNNEFRKGKSHSNCAGTADYIKQCLELARKITKDSKLLLRFDSGNDSVENILTINEYDNVYFLIKRNLRSEDREKYINLKEELEKDENANVIKEEVREGKVIYYYENIVILSGKLKGEKKEAIVRQIVRLTERTTDKNNQELLFPDHEVDVWYANVEEKHDSEKIVDLYKDHGTCEQFHSELKTDMDVERLPSGKFETNRLILSMSTIAFNTLRLIGQEVINSGNTNRKRKVARLRLRRVIQDIMYMAGKFMIKHKLPTIKLPTINKFIDAFTFVFRKIQLE